jgi:hypothetical protein
VRKSCDASWRPDGDLWAEYLLDHKNPPIASAFESRSTSASRDDRSVRVSKASSIKAEPNVKALGIVRSGSFHEGDLRQCHL